ncbi:MAG: alpha/beta fold hydrolase [Thermoanaerobaculia bacterium]
MTSSTETRRRPRARAALALALASCAVAGAAERPLRWTNGDVELAGALILPAGEAPYRAAVVLPPAGATGRDDPRVRGAARALAADGLAVLVFDPRGTGDSGGDPLRADFEDLAWDALTGVKLLRTLPEIDGAHIGLVGLSQGAQVAAVAASQDASLAFVVEISGGASTVADGAAWRVERAWRRRGAPAEDVTLALDLLGASNEIARGRGDWERYAALRREVEESYGADAVDGYPASPDDPYWSWWGRVVDFDPMTWWWTVDVPVLFLFAADDPEQPTRASVERIERSMESEGLDVTVRVLGGDALAAPDGTLRPDARHAIHELLAGLQAKP